MVIIHALGPIKRLAGEKHGKAEFDTYSVDAVCGEPTAVTFSGMEMYVNCPACLRILVEARKGKK